MRLAGFTTEAGDEIWINPDHVVAVTDGRLATEDPLCARIWTLTNEFVVMHAVGWTRNHLATP